MVERQAVNLLVVGSSPTEGVVFMNRFSIKFSLNDLPKLARKEIIEKATKAAGWNSTTEKGDGSSMAMEWLTFVYSKEKWIKVAEGSGCSLSESAKNLIRNMK